MQAYNEWSVTTLKAASLDDTPQLPLIDEKENPEVHPFSDTCKYPGYKIFCY